MSKRKVRLLFSGWALTVDGAALTAAVRSGLKRSSAVSVLRHAAVPNVLEVRYGASAIGSINLEARDEIITALNDGDEVWGEVTAVDTSRHGSYRLGFVIYARSAEGAARISRVAVPPVPHPVFATEPASWPKLNLGSLAESVSAKAKADSAKREADARDAKQEWHDRQNAKMQLQLKQQEAQQPIDFLVAPTKKGNTMTTIDTIVASNKNAATTAAIMEAGRIANNQVGKLAAQHLPLMLRGYANTTIGKVVIANAAAYAAQRLRPNDQKLTKLSNAMMVEAYQAFLAEFDVESMIEDLLGSATIKKALDKLDAGDAIQS